MFKTIEKSKNIYKKKLTEYLMMLIDKKIGGLAVKHANHDLHVMEKVLGISYEERAKMEDALYTFRQGEV